MTRAVPAGPASGERGLRGAVRDHTDQDGTDQDGTDQDGTDQDGPARDGPDAGSAAPVGRMPAPQRLRSVVLVLSGICLWVLWRTGPGKVPGVDISEGLARAWPVADLPPESAYVLRNSLGPLLYRLVPDPGTDRFLLLHAAALLLAGLLLACWLLRRLGARAGPVAIALLLLSPVTALLLLWIGLYDAFAVLVWVGVLIALPHRTWVQALAGAAAGAQNAEQVLVGLVLLALVPELPRALGLRVRLVPLLAAAVAGRLLLEAYLRTADAPAGSRLTYLLAPGVLEDVAAGFAVMAPLVLWSVLGGLWGFALVAVRDGWSRWSPSLRLRLALALALVLGCSLVTADHTRVIALITFPSVVLGCMVLAVQVGDLRRLLRRPEAWLLLLVPPVLVQADDLLRIGIKLGTWGIGPF